VRLHKKAHFVEVDYPSIDMFVCVDPCLVVAVALLHVVLLPPVSPVEHKLLDPAAFLNLVKSQRRRFKLHIISAARGPPPPFHAKDMDPEDTSFYPPRTHLEDVTCFPISESSPHLKMPSGLLTYRVNAPSVLLTYRVKHPCVDPLKDARHSGKQSRPEGSDVVH